MRGLIGQNPNSTDLKESAGGNIGPFRTCNFLWTLSSVLSCPPVCSSASGAVSKVEYFVFCLSTEWAQKFLNFATYIAFVSLFSWERHPLLPCTSQSKGLFTTYFTCSNETLHNHEEVLGFKANPNILHKTELPQNVLSLQS